MYKQFPRTIYIYLTKTNGSKFLKKLNQRDDNELLCTLLCLDLEKGQNFYEILTHLGRGTYYTICQGVILTP